VTGSGETIRSKAVVVTTGTFLRGTIVIGPDRFSAGRWGERPATALADTLARYKFPLSRLKTGTPPRLLASSIDFSGLTPQHADADPVPFSFLTDKPTNADNQVP
jgi:tRNA uridine 5-carboxymethylaminomethyl modification enzyme